MRSIRVHQRFQEERPISLGTIYRVLNRLAAAGILTRHAFNGSTMRFEAPFRRDHHMINVRTGQIVEIDDREFMLLIEQNGRAARLPPDRLQGRGDGRSSAGEERA